MHPHPNLHPPHHTHRPDCRCARGNSERPSPTHRRIRLAPHHIHPRAPPRLEHQRRRPHPRRTHPPLTRSDTTHRPYSLGTAMVRAVHHDLRMGNRTGFHPPSPPSHQPQRIHRRPHPPQSPHQPIHSRSKPAATLKSCPRSLVIFYVRTYASVYMNCFLVLCIVEA